MGVRAGRLIPGLGRQVNKLFYLIPRKGHIIQVMNDVTAHTLEMIRLAVILV